MILNVGDKVSFLNERRDGIVKKVLNNKMVLVEIEAGFDIPVLSSDLIKVQSYEDLVSQKRTEKVLSDPRQEEKLEEIEERFPARIGFADENDYKIKKSLYLAFIPENPEDVLSSGFGIYLLNHNSCDVLFTYMLKEDDKFICKDYEQVDEESAVLLDVIDKTDIEKWKDVQIQCLFFKQDVTLHKPPMVYEIQIRPVRFYKDDNFIFYSLLNEKCFLLPLTEKGKSKPTEWPEEKWENEKVAKPSGLKIIGHINNLNKTESFPEKHIIEKSVAEVDLHIEELTENYAGKENFELLSIQMDYFSKMMELAIANKLQKIIFIHGVGNGRLKNEITERLKNNFPELKFTDASFLKYGKGATEIILS
jgi:hypothetical protein